MTAVNAWRFFVHHLLRRHWRATVILGVGLGIAMAVPMSAWTVARRTDGAFPAFVRHSYAGLDGAVAQGIICPEGTTEAEIEATNGDVCFGESLEVETQRLVARPDVIAATRYSYVIGNVVVPATGEYERQGIELFHSDPIVLDGELVSVGNAEGRGHLVDGRMADFNADEVVVNEAFMSMPAATPDDVHRLRSTTHRASGTHSTCGPCLRTHPNERLFDVAR